jgi:hypothetical protein
MLQSPRIYRFYRSVIRAHLVIEPSMVDACSFETEPSVELKY